MENNDRLILPEYIGQYEFKMGNAPTGEVRLAVISEFSGNKQNYRNFKLSDSISAFKQKLHFLVGTEPKWMEITIKNDSQVICVLDSSTDESQPLSSLNLNDGFEVHVKDVDPKGFMNDLMDPSNTSKYVMSEETYKKRENSVRKFKENEMQKQFSSFQIGSACQVLCGQPEELLEGKISYVGLVEGTQGTWIGITLSVPKGKNDGSAKGKRYFECEANYGVFVRPEKVKIEKKDEISEY